MLLQLSGLTGLDRRYLMHTSHRCVREFRGDQPWSLSVAGMKGAFVETHLSVHALAARLISPVMLDGRMPWELWHVQIKTLISLIRL